MFVVRSQDGDRPFAVGLFAGKKTGFEANINGELIIKAYRKRRMMGPTLYTRLTSCCQITVRNRHRRQRQRVEHEFARRSEWKDIRRVSLERYFAGPITTTYYMTEC